ncbi:MAG: hypothetical protein U0794_17955 [Isosphaeraceae bacterium]
MATKRGSSRAAGSAPAAATTPILNAVMVVAAVAYGISILVHRGTMSWPPHQLMASLFTVSGCLAVVGPIVLSRGEGEGGLGELLWMTGGLLVWVFDAVALLRGEWRTTAWVTPLGYQTMGLTILAVLLAGWRCRINGRGWSWTNVTGWVLGLFWVALAFTSMWTSRGVGVAMR